MNWYPWMVAGGLVLAALILIGIWNSAARSRRERRDTRRDARRENPDEKESQG